MYGAAHLASVVLAGCGLACATSVQVAFDEREDFSRYDTWGWQARGASSVDSALGTQVAFDARLTALIARSLADRGYERGEARPDLLVSYHLALRHRAAMIDVPRAPYLLSSNHSSASYWIEGSDTQQRIYIDLELSIEIAEGSGRVLWRGALRRRFEEHERLDLDAAVATLFERFPKVDPGNAPENH